MSQPIMPGHECAVCGALKRDTNHWWMGMVTLTGTLSILHWRRDFCTLEGVYPACGRNCTQKLVERYLHTGCLDAPRGAAGNPVEVKQ